MVDPPDKRGYTPLMLACEQGHLERARALLVDGPSTDLTDNEGNTALMVASRLGHLEMARLLLEAGRAA